jgi:5-methylcytosine-specific restriction protein B
MAIGDAAARRNLDAVVGLWRDRCLLDDGSLLFEDRVWTPESLDRVYHKVVEAPLLDNRSFIEKLEVQLEGDRSLVRLGAEAMVVYYLFAHRSAVSPDTKRARINQILVWAGDALDEESKVWRALGEEGIGHPGQYFLLRPDTQLGYIVDFARRLKETDVDSRRRILEDPWQSQDFADAGADEGAASMRHILLHLLHPESFERILAGGGGFR